MQSNPTDSEQLTNHLLAIIEEQTALQRSSKHYWAIVELARTISRRLTLRDPAIVAQCAILSYHLTSLHLSELHRDWSDEQIVDCILPMLQKTRALDILPLGRPLREPDLRKHLHHATFSLYPTLPRTSQLNRLATSKLITDCYRSNHYPDLLASLPHMEKLSTISLTFRIPTSANVTLRLLHLFARCTIDDMLTFCILHAWETLGRGILHAAGSSTTVTAAINHLLTHHTPISCEND
jgi:hypothetical protein